MSELNYKKELVNKFKALVRAQGSSKVKVSKAEKEFIKSMLKAMASENSISEK